MENGHVTIVWTNKKRTGLNLTSYILAETICNLSANSSGWCYATKKKLAEMIDVTPRHLNRVLNALVDKGWIEKHPDKYRFKTTDKWFNATRGGGQNVPKEDKMSQNAETGEDKMSDSLYKVESDNSILNNKEKDISDTKSVSDKRAGENQSPPSRKKKKSWKDPWCASRWYEEEFAPLYEQYAGQAVVFGGKEFGCAKNFFDRLRQLNPDISPEDLYWRASDGAAYVFDSWKHGGEFAWSPHPPDIGFMVSQVQKINYSLDNGKMTEEELIEQHEREEILDKLKAIDRESEKERRGQINGEKPEQLEGGYGILIHSSRH